MNELKKAEKMTNIERHKNAKNLRTLQEVEKLKEAIS